MIFLVAATRIDSGPKDAVDAVYAPDPASIKPIAEVR